MALSLSIYHSYRLLNKGVKNILAEKIVMDFNACIKKCIQNGCIK
jgi:hypothetical protein